MSAPNKSFERLQNYEQRSLAFEPGHTEGQASSGEWAGVIFRIGDVQLACSVNQVHEFLPIPVFTPVPGAKPWIMGLANVRGDLMTIVDLAGFLNDQCSTISMRTRLLVASLHGRPVGLLVDEVFGQRNFVSDEGNQPQLPENSPLKEFVHKQYRSGKDTWQQLDLEMLFSNADFLNGAAD